VCRITLAWRNHGGACCDASIGSKAIRHRVSDTEIKVGQTIAFSGPASAFGTHCKVEAAYFRWLNETKRGITMVS
jgi:hypothetical protein